MAPKSSIDLHVHSTASDGRMVPAEVVGLAAELGLSAIALTDHDTTDGLTEARNAAAAHGVSVLSGIELSSDSESGNVDFLGYCFDPENAMLQATLNRLREGRVERAKQIVAKLNDLGVSLGWAEVKKFAPDGSIGRPHIARALMAGGHAASRSEAFRRWINIDGPAYVPRFRQSPQEIITLIREAGGIAVLAHPARSDTAWMVPELVDMGLGGLEAYYASHTKKQIRKLLRLARKYDLITTGGSDFHGLANNGTVSLGSAPVPPETLEQLASVS